MAGVELPQPLLDNLWVDPLAEQVCGMAVPESMKANLRDPRSVIHENGASQNRLEERLATHSVRIL
jgi:hypothetical protein